MWRILTREVDDAPATDGGDNADQGVISDKDGDNDLPEDDDIDSDEDNSDSDEDDANMDDGTPENILNEDSVDNETSPVQRTSGRVTRKPNVIIPTMTGKVMEIAVTKE